MNESVSCIAGINMSYGYATRVPLTYSERKAPTLGAYLTVLSSRTSTPHLPFTPPPLLSISLSFSLSYSLALQFLSLYTRLDINIIDSNYPATREQNVNNDIINIKSLWIQASIIIWRVKKWNFKNFVYAKKLYLFILGLMAYFLVFREYLYKFLLKKKLFPKICNITSDNVRWRWSQITHIAADVIIWNQKQNKKRYTQEGYCCILPDILITSVTHHFRDIYCKKKLVRKWIYR